MGENGFIITISLVGLFSLISLVVFLILPAITAPLAERKQTRKTLLIAMVIGTLYAGLCHILARLSDATHIDEDSIIVVVSIGYVFVLPVVVGFNTIWLASPDD